MPGSLPRSREIQTRPLLRDGYAARRWRVVGACPEPEGVYHGPALGGRGITVGRNPAAVSAAVRLPTDRFADSTDRLESVPGAWALRRGEAICPPLPADGVVGRVPILGTR
ncbi:MAG: hypothetical protein QOJ25_1281, partial [Solirubrobacteraceae bacterium]|nr:hypothetical protein [Solirubrobacteraceae bacterium]